VKAKRIVYIGNKLKGKGSNVTTIETLGIQLTTLGYTVYTFSSVRNKLLRLLDMLGGVITKGRKADVVLIDTYSTQNFYYAVAVANLCRLLRIPYVPILHGGNLPERLQKNKYVSYKLFHGAKTNVAPSRYLMEIFSSEGYKNLTYIPNTIEIQDYPFLLRNEIAPKLLWVRSFAEIYNPMLALNVLKKLRESYPQASLCMVGPDKDGSLEKCKEYARQHELPITFTGRLSKQEWRQKSIDYDIFINTTNFDNTPVSVIEAMALGLPIVSTRVGGIPYLIEDHIDGLLVPPNNSESFVDAIGKLCTVAELGSTLSTQARKKAEAFDWQKVKVHWLTLLKQ
jgi:glycosyltransferase involved in cell wall biosynthesis